MISKVRSRRFQPRPISSPRIPIAIVLASIATATASIAAAPSAAAPESPLTLAVRGLGGTERIAHLKAWIVEGEGRENLTAELQGREPEIPTWRPHREAIGIDRSRGAVAWERRTPRNDESLRWRRFVYTPDSTGVVDWTGPWARMRVAPTTAASRAGFERRIPHLLLLEAVTGAESIAVRSASRVDVRLVDGVRLALEFSGEPPKLASATYPIDMPGFGMVTVRWSWQDWQPHPTLGWVPSRHEIAIGEHVYQEVRYTRFESQPGAASDLVRIPAIPKSVAAVDAEPPPAPGGPSTGEVAPGVHVVEAGNFLGMFVACRDFVVVFDAPAAAPGYETIPARGAGNAMASAQELQAAIARTYPGKPVRYVVLSHHHSDHLGGAAAFASAGVTFLASPGHVHAVHRAIRAARGSLAGVRVDGVRTKRVLDGGDQRLEVIQVGDNPHTLESLFVWLPEPRVLLQGDLFYFVAGEPFPPSGRATMNRFFARWLEAQGMAPSAIYGLHAEGAAGPEALARARRSEPRAP